MAGVAPSLNPFPTVLEVEVWGGGHIVADHHQITPKKTGKMRDKTGAISRCWDSGDIVNNKIKSRVPTFSLGLPHFRTKRHGGVSRVSSSLPREQHSKRQSRVLRRKRIVARIAGGRRFIKASGSKCYETEMTVGGKYTVCPGTLKTFNQTKSEIQHFSSPPPACAGWRSRMNDTLHRTAGLF